MNKRNISESISIKDFFKVQKLENNFSHLIIYKYTKLMDIVHIYRVER
jgi:hypothetical protein